MEKIRVLRILNRTNIGGPVYNAIFLTKHLNTQFQSILLAGVTETTEQNADDFLKYYDVSVEYISEMKRSINPLQDYFAYKAVKKRIKEFKPHIVHTHAAKAGAIGRLAAAHAKVPIILHTFHGHVFHSYFNKLVTNFFIQFEKYLAKKSTQIIAISDTQKQELSQVYNICKPDKISVIPNGIDLTKFATNQQTKRAQWRKDYLFTEDDILIGIVGRLAPVKNHLMFTKAVKKVLGTINKNIHFVIIGDGESLNEIKENFDGLHINYIYETAKPSTKAPVLFTSWQSNMDEIYAALDIVCLTSLNEGTPISLIEAQAAYKPIVTTNVGGVKDTVVENETAFLTKVDDVDLFAQKIIELIQNEKLRNAMGKAGYEFVLKKYSHLRLADDMNNLYNKLIAEKGIV